jgi:multidrug resistance efflux pump
MYWLVLVAATFFAVAAHVYIPSFYQVETDDAYIEADTVSVVPKVADDLIEGPSSSPVLARRQAQRIRR